ncbi:MAG: NYN domain-containing protein [Bacteroidota bacterium]
MDKAEINLAVLIDADNIPATYVKEMLEEMAKYGTPTLKRIYGDWTSTRMTQWKAVLLEHAITPIQQYSYTRGKNATDSAMIIDAMDILYSGRVNAFCLVSSDSDFTRLATRLREEGLKVYGFGEKKTPKPFMAACDKFIYLEILKEEEPTGTTSSTAKSKAKTFDKITPKVLRLIRSTIEDLADEDGWAHMADVGNLLQKKRPNFDSRNYGFQKLTPLLDSTGKFEIERREDQKGRKSVIYIKKKSRR